MPIDWRRIRALGKDTRGCHHVDLGRECQTMRSQASHLQFVGPPRDAWKLQESPNLSLLRPASHIGLMDLFSTACCPQMNSFVGRPPPVGALDRCSTHAWWAALGGDCLLRGIGRCRTCAVVAFPAEGDGAWVQWFVRNEEFNDVRRWGEVDRSWHFVLSSVLP